MKDTVARLAHARHIETALKELLARRETELRATPQWQQWEAESIDLRAAMVNVLSAETEVRDQALAAYATTGDKAPHPAVKIKIYTMLDYEPADALDYAREHLPQALEVIKRTFEKAAKVLELDFVDFTEEPRATIARDLSEYLPQE